MAKKILVRATIQIPEGDMLAKTFLKGLFSRMELLHLSTKPKEARKELLPDKQLLSERRAEIKLCSICHCWPCRCAAPGGTTGRGIVRYVGKNQQGTTIEWEVSRVNEISMPLPPDKERTEPPTAT